MKRRSRLQKQKCLNGGKLIEYLPFRSIGFQPADRPFRPLACSGGSGRNPSLSCRLALKGRQRQYHLAELESINRSKQERRK
jgi:hypothetical protein